MAYVDSLIGLLERLLRDYLVTVRRTGRLRLSVQQKRARQCLVSKNSDQQNTKAQIKEKDKCPTLVADSITGCLQIQLALF